MFLISFQLNRVACLYAYPRLTLLYWNLFWLTTIEGYLQKINNNTAEISGHAHNMLFLHKVTCASHERQECWYSFLITKFSPYITLTVHVHSFSMKELNDGELFKTSMNRLFLYSFSLCIFSWLQNDSWITLTSF